MPLGRTIWPSFSNIILSFLIFLGFFRGFVRWITSPNFAIILMLCASPKPQIQNPSHQSSRVFSLLSPLQVASNGECPRAISMQSTSLIEELNRHQKAVLCYVQRTIHLGFITKVFKAQCFMKSSHVFYTSTILG